MRPRFLAIETGMLRRLRVLGLFVGAIWLAFGVVRIVYAERLGVPVITALALVIGVGFVAFSVLCHLEIRERSREG